MSFRHSATVRLQDLVCINVSNRDPGQLNPEKMITSKIKLDEVVEKGFQALVNDRDSHCKILVDVQAW